jgi:hypothetical protein
MKTVKRTFEARNYPIGHPDRTRLNLDWLTSEYMPSYRYGVREDDGAYTPFIYRTKTEAEARAAQK